MRKNYYLILLFFTTIALSSCERDMETEGPDLVDLYGEFSILDPFAVSQKTVDFSTGENVFFTARFSKIIDWKLTIKGKVSGAEKIIEGKTRSIDATNAIWLGETTKLPIFQAEVCDVLLSVANNSLKFTETINVTGIKSQEAFVVADFENGWNDKWLTFVQSGADMSFRITDDDPAAQGNFYYDMGGLVNWDWLIGMIEFPASAYGANTFDLNENADKLYFNTMLYLPPGITNPLILIQFREDDNEDGSFDEATEDMYAVEIRAGDLETGWNLYSIKYSDLTALVNGSPAEPKGNKSFEPNKLWRLSVLYLANPASGYAQTYMDYVVFTDNEPLKP